MKRFAAIILMIAHFFNLGGYMALNQYMVYQADKFINQQISKGKYDRTNLIEIKIPQRLPQIQNWSSYMRITGQIQFKGVAYNYVKLKITQDTLFVQCIPNYQTTKLITENVIYAKQINDIPVNKKAHESNGKKMGADNKYNYTVISFRFLPTAEIIQQPGSFVYFNIMNPHMALNGQPPEKASC